MAERSTFDTSPITAKERVDHCLSDNQEAWAYIFGDNVSVTLLLGAITISAIHETGGHGRLVRVLVAGWTACFGLNAYIGCRYMLRRIRRERLSRKLEGERKRVDPKYEFPTVLIIHSDRDKESVLMFHILTEACYGVGMAVMQYHALAWPRYGHLATPPPGTVGTWVMPRTDVSFVGCASAVVWLDHGTINSSVRLELQETIRIAIPVLRVQLPQTSKRYVVDNGNEPHEINDTAQAVSWIVEQLAMAVQLRKQVAGQS